MTIALMSRGYLYPVARLMPTIAPPTITGVTKVVPEIQHVTIQEDKAPRIVSAKEERPTIRGATTSAPLPQPKPPSIVGAKKLVPTIRKVKKE